MAAPVGLRESSLRPGSVTPGTRFVMKVLVADDSAVPRLILEKNLTALGHEIAAAADGDEAWALYQSFAPDVILSDWLMPGLDGIELCRRIRSDPIDRYTYFVLLTSMTEVEHVITAMVAGADDFMVKPLERTALEATLIGARRVTELHEQLRDQRASLERLNSLLFDDARRDPLTLLGNRLRLSEDLAAAVARVERYGHSYCIALLDIDFFKRYNDRFGHPAGDLALRSVAQVLAGSVRAGDMVYRYGGEEFLILVPEQTLATAAVVLDRVRRAVEDLRLPHPDNPPTNAVTVSGGVAATDATSNLSVNDWLRRADQALYQAKATGRNRVVAFDSDLEAA
jgi:diguanylate cyclase (GGDEF)-like protein